MFDDLFGFDDWYGGDRDGRESGGEEREFMEKRENMTWEFREKTIKKIKCKALDIYMITVASLDIYKPLQSLMHVYFMLYCVNFCTFCILHSLMQLL